MHLQMDLQCPGSFDYEVNPDWHQLTLYNPNLDSASPQLNGVDVEPWDFT